MTSSVDIIKYHKGSNKDAFVERICNEIPYSLELAFEVLINNLNTINNGNVSEE